MVLNLDMANTSSIGDCAHIGGGLVIDNKCQKCRPFMKRRAENKGRGLRSVVRLLETAGQTLAGGDKQAHQCLAKATALLQAECEPALRSGGSASARCSMPPWKMARVLELHRR